MTFDEWFFAHKDSGVSVTRETFMDLWDVARAQDKNNMPTVFKIERVEMPTMHELFDGSDTDLLGVFLNTIDEHTTFGDAFLAGLAAGKDCTLIAGVDADLHSPSLFMDDIPGKVLASSDGA